jgi:hypothetical protein
MLRPSVAPSCLLDRHRGRLAQLVRAPALQAGCRGFKSLTAHQIYAVTSLRRHFRSQRSSSQGPEPLYLLLN